MSTIVEAGGGVWITCAELAKRRGVDPGVLKGLFLAMALLFLLNAGCWGAARFNP